jgi:DNA repair protein RadC
LYSSSGIICLHNHPSGDVNPSRDDISFTKALVEIGNIQKIPVLDHIIVSNDSYYSFLENGML